MITDALVDQDAGLLGHLHHKKHSDLIAPKYERSFGNSGGQRYALHAWTRFEILGAPQGPCGDRTSADDLHLDFTKSLITIYLLQFLNKQQHTDTGH